MIPLLPAITKTRHDDLSPFVNQIFCMDALDLLATLPDASVDLIVTDPPYGIGYESSWTTRISDGKPRNTLMSFGHDVLDTRWIADAARVLKEGGALYCFTRWDVLHHWQQAINATDLHVVTRIVWYKAQFKMGDLRYYAPQTEDILFARKGTHRLRWHKREGNVWYSADALYLDGYYGHPTQKPEVILRRAIEYSSDPDDVVLDPFAGSGSTCAAAFKSARQYIGGDINPVFVNIARERVQNSDPYQDTELANGQKQLSLFTEGQSA